MEFVVHENEVYLKNEKEVIIAKLSFEETNHDEYCISSIFVDEAFRGKNIASNLMEYTVKKMKNMGAKKICATCSYAVHWLEKNNI